MSNKKLLTYVFPCISTTRGFLEKFIENLPKYRETDTATKKELKKKSYNKWMGYLLLKSSDQNKYGSILNNMTSQYSLKNNQYPDGVTMATDVLANHKFDATYKDKKKADSRKSDQSVSTTTTESSFAQKKNNDKQKCYCCRNEGHISPDCPQKDQIPKNQWAIRRVEQHMQAENETPREEEK